MSSTSREDAHSTFPSSEASLAAAAAASSLDPVVLNALENPRDRLMLLKLDRDLIKFLTSAAQKSQLVLDLPAMSSYHRMLAHRVAGFFQLEHVSIDAGPEKSFVRLIKTSDSKAPSFRISDLALEYEDQEALAFSSNFGPAASSNASNNLMSMNSGGVKQIMKRSSNRSRSSGSNQQKHQNQKSLEIDSTTAAVTMTTTNTKSQTIRPTNAAANAPQRSNSAEAEEGRGDPMFLETSGKFSASDSSLSPSDSEHASLPRTKSLDEREEEYARARARIFGDNSPATPVSSNTMQPTTTTAALSTSNMASGATLQSDFNGAQQQQQTSSRVLRRGEIDADEIHEYSRHSLPRQQIAPSALHFLPQPGMIAGPPLVLGPPPSSGGVGPPPAPSYHHHPFGAGFGLVAPPGTLGMPYPSSIPNLTPSPYASFPVPPSPPRPHQSPSPPPFMRTQPQFVDVQSPPQVGSLQDFPPLGATQLRAKPHPSQKPRQ